MARWKTWQLQSMGKIATKNHPSDFKRRMDSRRGKKRAGVNAYWGMSGVIDVAYSTRTPEGTKHLISLLKRAICRNDFYPFEGIVTAQDGTVMCGQGEILTPAEIMMDWLADNVIGRIPEPKELTKEARAVVRINRNAEGAGKGMKR